MAHRRTSRSSVSSRWRRPASSINKATAAGHSFRLFWKHSTVRWTVRAFRNSSAVQKPSCPTVTGHSGAKLSICLTFQLPSFEVFSRSTLRRNRSTWYRIFSRSKVDRHTTTLKCTCMMPSGTQCIPSIGTAECWRSLTWEAPCSALTIGVSCNFSYISFCHRTAHFCTANFHDILHRSLSCQHTLPFPSGISGNTKANAYYSTCSSCSLLYLWHIIVPRNHSAYICRLHQTPL
mmetsp:Transcript_4161/g.9829  ORF Transcript_4161/g.9829 Transcript_4161/m.9829 type:complete len:234 (-) Transcript_4161:893-1594(-)